MPDIAANRSLFLFFNIYANLCSLHILASIRISLNAKDALLAILSNAQNEHHICKKISTSFCSSITFFSRLDLSV